MQRNFKEDLKLFELVKLKGFEPREADIEIHSDGLIHFNSCEAAKTLKRSESIGLDNFLDYPQGFLHQECYDLESNVNDGHLSVPEATHLCFDSLLEEIKYLLAEYDFTKNPREQRFEENVKTLQRLDESSFWLQFFNRETYAKLNYPRDEQETAEIRLKIALELVKEEDKLQEFIINHLGEANPHLLFQRAKEAGKDSELRSLIAEIDQILGKDQRTIFVKSQDPAFDGDRDNEYGESWEEEDYYVHFLFNQLLAAKNKGFNFWQIPLELEAAWERTLIYYPDADEQTILPTGLEANEMATFDLLATAQLKGNYNFEAVLNSAYQGMLALRN